MGSEMCIRDRASEWRCEPHVRRHDSDAEEFSGMDVDTMTQDQIESVLSAFAAQRQQHTHRMNEYVALAGP